MWSARAQDQGGRNPFYRSALLTIFALRHIILSRAANPVGLVQEILPVARRRFGVPVDRFVSDTNPSGPSCTPLVQIALTIDAAERIIENLRTQG